MASISPDPSGDPLEDVAERFRQLGEEARLSAHELAQDALDQELTLFDRLLEQATAPLSRTTEDDQPAAMPVFEPGDVSRTQHAFRQAWLVRERLLAQQRCVPRNGSVSSSALIFADAQLIKAQQGYDGALSDRKAARDQAVGALVSARDFATAAEERTAIAELVALDAVELDRRWEAHHAVERVAAERGRLADAAAALPRGRPVRDGYAHLVEARLAACAEEEIDEPDSLAEMDRQLDAGPGTLSKRLKAHPEQFRRKFTVAWLERLTNTRSTRQPRGSQKQTSRKSAP
jgi:hypothetical protein